MRWAWKEREKGKGEREKKTDYTGTAVMRDE
jgi:hypothetical protein